MFNLLKWSKALKSNQKGFTLVELMVVVVIIGVLVAIAIPIYNTVSENADRNACHASQRTIDGAVQMARADEDGDWENWEDYIQGTPECPDGGEYIVNEDGVDGCPNTDPDHGHYAD